MSWFLGKKKHHKEPTVDSFEDLTAAAQESFPAPPNIQDGTPYPADGLYPAISGMQINERHTPPRDLSKQHQQVDMEYYLNGVPFKLSKLLEYDLNNDLEISRLCMNEILSYIQRIEEQNFDYDFSLEKSVISEMNSANNE